MRNLLVLVASPSRCSAGAGMNFADRSDGLRRGGRHTMATIEVRKAYAGAQQAGRGAPLREADPEVWAAVEGELERQRHNIELIASENFVSRAVLEATGSVLTNKYAEGLPHKRYYGGCEYVDVAEDLAIERAKALFGAEHANVQPHSGSQAN